MHTRKFLWGLESRDRATPPKSTATQATTMTHMWTHITGQRQSAVGATTRITPTRAHHTATTARAGSPAESSSARDPGMAEATMAGQGSGHSTIAVSGRLTTGADSVPLAVVTMVAASVAGMYADFPEAACAASPEEVFAAAVGLAVEMPEAAVDSAVEAVPAAEGAVPAVEAEVGRTEAGTGRLHR